jgi:hypothetical protein
VLGNRSGFCNNRFFSHLPHRLVSLSLIHGFSTLILSTLQSLLRVRHAVSGLQP